MRRSRLEVADVIRAHGGDFMTSRNGSITSAERRVLRDIAACRTATLGGHVERCDRCGHEAIAYNSCRNRHCPKCQAQARADWFERRQVDLLPVEYFHVVFSLPREVAAIALQNKKVVYGILFRAAAETLQQVAADPKHLGAEIGLLAVLHTWGQTMEHHPHIHCIVPGGGISEEQHRWVPCRPGFFLPVRILSRVFRGKFLHHLHEAFETQKLTLRGSLTRHDSKTAFRAYISPLYHKKWVVYAKPPFGGPAQVLKYLARYTHRVAIANSRLVKMQEGKVSFRWKDYAHGSKHKIMTLTATEFIRRFLLHVLPRSFVRIRYYGFLANRCRKESIALIRNLIQDATEGADPAGHNDNARGHDPDERTCPACNEGTMVLVSILRPGGSLSTLPTPASIDSS